MKVTTKGRYGLKIMIELAICFKSNLLTAKALAQGLSISEKYVEQIIATLTKSGLLISQRGATGGYRLALPPKEISVGDVIRATEGDIHVTDCVSDLGEPSPDCSGDCPAHTVWVQVKEAVVKVVDSISLESLARSEHKKKEAN